MTLHCVRVDLEGNPMEEVEEEEVTPPETEQMVIASEFYACILAL